MPSGLKKKVMEAHQRCKPARDALHASGYRCMEVTEDRAGIVWERWISPKLNSVILFATPTWWDVFESMDPGGSVPNTIDAIRQYAQRDH